MRSRLKKDRRSAYRFGHFAEWYCMAWLVLKGYSILARRYRNHYGEIDIIAQRGGLIVFVEVKARARAEDALVSVTPQKRMRTERAAAAFVASYKNTMQLSLRFDVMVVTSLLRIIHLTNAWSGA